MIRRALPKPTVEFGPHDIVAGQQPRERGFTVAAQGLPRPQVPMLHGGKICPADIDSTTLIR